MRPPAPAPITSTSVSIKMPSGPFMPLPGPRPVLHRRMHVDDVFGTEYLAAEAGDAVLAELDDRQQLGAREPGDLLRHGHRLHVDDVRRAHQVADPAAGALIELDILDHAEFITELGPSVPAATESLDC